MAFKECEKCGALITDTTTSCPRCGNKRGRGKKRWELALTAMVFLGAIAWLSFFLLSDNQQLVKENLKKIVGQPLIIYDHQDVQVMEDHYRQYQVKLKGTAELIIDYTVKSGPHVDVFFFDSNNYGLWKKGFSQFTDEEYEYIEELSSFGMGHAIKSHRVDAGIYYVIFDNTSLGPTSPPVDFKNDIVILDFKVYR